MTNEELIHKLVQVHFKPSECNNMSSTDWDNLITLVKKVQVPNMKICEIGTNTGFSTAALGLLAKEVNGHVTTIDPYKRKDGNGNHWRDCFWINMAGFGLDSKTITHVQERSQDAHVKFQDNFFDLIFIDGDHFYEAVKADIIKYYPKVKKGGIICGHDCEVFCKDNMIDITTIPDWNNRDTISIHIGVVRAVSEYFNGNAKIHGDRVWSHTKL